MILLFFTLFYLIPTFAGYYLIGVANVVGYTILSAIGVQLLIGYCGQVTLGHAAFLAVGAYTCTLSLLQLHLPYPITLALGGIVGRVVVCSVRTPLCASQRILSHHDHHGSPIHHRGVLHHPICQ